MSSLEEFGPYLLLKKLSEDPLGETFRAGKIGGAGVEQVVLLRIFNGRTINGLHLWQTIKGRSAVHQALKSPNIGNGVDLGEVRGVPYAAYDYISGKSLANLLVKASTENTPIPTDHALLIAERLALALSMAQEAKIGGERILHGFVVPQLTMISNEGEARLLGFEVAPGLRDLARSGAFGVDVSRYLPAEALAAEESGEVGRADDAYSLGVILFELLTCAPLPAPGPEGFGEVVDAAEISQEGVPLPAEVAELIKRSLAPRGQRIADAPDWHKAVSKVLADGGYGATTFNLAFFMHNLFRNEIERESEEIEAEKTIEVPSAVLAAGAETGGAATAEAQAPTAVAASAAAESLSRAGAERAGGGRSRLWIGLAAALVLLLGGAGAYYFAFLRGPDAAPLFGTAPEPAPAEAESPPPPLVEPPEAAPAEPAGPTPEELQEQLTKMIESRSAEMEAKLKAQYDERIRALQGQLQDTQEAAARREAELRDQRRREAEAALAAQQAAAPPPTRPPAPAASAPDAAPEPVQSGAATGAAAAGASPPAAQPAAPTGTASRPPPSTSTAAPPVKPPPAPQSAPPAKREQPPEPRVRVGDLVSFGPGVKPPELIRMPDPNFPTLAKRLNKSATVEVRLLVDEKGEVLETEISGQKAGFGFDQSALEAARRATYKPATKDGVRVKMWTLLKVRFAQ